MKMPIGIYKGQDVAALPTKYLAWLVSQDAIRFKRWPLMKEALRVLRKRFESFEALEAELKVDTPPPEYWKTAKRTDQKKAEQAEKLRALEKRRAEEVGRPRFQVIPGTITDASYYARQARVQALQAELAARQKPADPNDVSDLI